MLLSYNADLLPRVRMLGCIRYNQPWIHFSRVIDEYILYIVRDGDLYMQESGEKYHLKAGDFFLLEPGLPHEGYQKAPCEYYYAHFTHPHLLRVPNDSAALADLEEKRRRSLLSDNLSPNDPTDPITYLPKCFHLPGDEFKSAMHRMSEDYADREEHYKRRVSAEFHSFLLQVSHEYLQTNSLVHRKVRRSDAIAEQLLRYLTQNYSKQLTSDGIAQQFGVNFDYINRVFSQMTGSTIFAYLNTLRIHNAKQLIATTDLPISEVAYLVGIEDR